MSKRRWKSKNKECEKNVRKKSVWSENAKNDWKEKYVKSLKHWH